MQTFKYDRLPVPITELEGAESFDIVLRKQNGDIVKTTYDVRKYVC